MSQSEQRFNGISLAVAPTRRYLVSLLRAISSISCTGHSRHAKCNRLKVRLLPSGQLTRPTAGPCPNSRSLSLMNGIKLLTRLLKEFTVLAR